MYNVTLYFLLRDKVYDIESDLKESFHIMSPLVIQAEFYRAMNN